MTGSSASRRAAAAGRVVVTGASGFVGTHACRALVAAGWQVTGYGRRPRPAALPADVDYRRWDLASGPLRAAPTADAVVHAAATVDDAAPLREHLPATLTGTAHVLTSWPGVRLVHVSSASVYPSFTTGPLHEDDGPGTEFTSPYAHAKALAEHLVAREAARTGRSAVLLRPHAVYGPGDPTVLPRLRAAVRGAHPGVLPVPALPGVAIHLTSVATLAAAVVAACVGTAEGPVNVADRAPVDLHATLSEVLRGPDGRSPRLLPIPAPAARAAATVAEPLARLAGRRPTLTRYLVGHLGYPTRYDLTRLRTELGVDPPATDLRAAISPGAASSPAAG